jgi:hypothetical protein
MSTIIDGLSSPKQPKVEPIPTRDTAADAVSADDERRRKIGAGYGAGTQMLSGSGGVASELTGTRSAGG